MTGKNPKYLEINLFQYHFIHVKPQTDPRSSNRDLHGRYTTSSKSQSFRVNSLPIYTHTVVTGSHHNIWVIYLPCLGFLSLIFRIQLVFLYSLTYKTSQFRFLKLYQVNWQDAAVSVWFPSTTPCKILVNTSRQPTTRSFWFIVHDHLTVRRLTIAFQNAQLTT